MDTARQIISTLSLGALIASCGASPQSQIRAEDSADKPIVVLETESALGHITMTADHPLSKAKAIMDKGVLIISWESTQPGQGTLELSFTSHTKETLTMSFGEGLGALRVDATGHIFTIGQLTATHRYKCGPQGMMCTGEIPVYSAPKPHSCGPQGAMCSPADSRG